MKKKKKTDKKKNKYVWSFLSTGQSWQVVKKKKTKKKKKKKKKNSVFFFIQSNKKEGKKKKKKKKGANITPLRPFYYFFFPPSACRVFFSFLGWKLQQLFLNTFCVLFFFFFFCTDEVGEETIQIKSCLFIYGQKKLSIFPIVPSVILSSINQIYYKA